MGEGTLLDGEATTGEGICKKDKKWIAKHKYLGCDILKKRARVTFNWCLMGVFQVVSKNKRNPFQGKFPQFEVFYSVFICEGYLWHVTIGFTHGQHTRFPTASLPTLSALVPVCFQEYLLCDVFLFFFWLDLF